MESFNDLFPGFVSSCVTLHGLMIPCAMALLVASFGFFFWQTHHQPAEIFRFLTFLFLVCLLITHSRELINDAQTAIQNFVTDNIKGRPENVAERYKTLLAEISNSPDVKDESFLSMLFSSNFFEAIVYAELTLISWLAMVVVFFVFIVQKVVLMLCWAVSPPLFALFTIRPLSSIATRHALRIVGLLLWNIGIALASCVTDGLLDLQIRNGLLIDSVSGNVPSVTPGVSGWGMMQMLSLAVIAIWVVVSSIVAPLCVQRIIASSGSPEGLLPRAGELLVNLGIPSLLSLTRSEPRPRSDSNSRPNNPGPVPVPPMPKDTPAPQPTPLEKEFVTPTDKTDPAAERRVEEAIKNPAHETPKPEPTNATTDPKSTRDFTPTTSDVKSTRVFRK